MVAVRKQVEPVQAALVPVEIIERRIYFIRGHKVMLDSDLAELYAVPTGTLNQAVRRNRERFPKDFMFRLSAREFENLISQIVISSWVVHGICRMLLQSKELPCFPVCYAVKERFK